MNLDDLVRGADPTRNHTDEPDPGLLGRVLDAGPASSGTGGRTALLVGILTAVVTLSVVGGVALVRRDATTSAAPSPTASSAADPVANCLSLVRGWRPTYLPPGFEPYGTERAEGSYSRQQQYALKSRTQPVSATYLSIARFCLDPRVNPLQPTATTSSPPRTPGLTIRGHPAFLSDYGGSELLEISWREEPNLSIVVQTSTSTPGKPDPPLLSVAELIRVANGLVHDEATADPSPRPDCPGLTSYRAATLPPGYRLAKANANSEDNLDLSYVKGTGSAAVTVYVGVSCHTVLEHYPPRDMDRIAVNGKEAWISPPGDPHVSILLQERAPDFWILIGTQTPDKPQPTRDEALTIARSLGPR